MGNKRRESASFIMNKNLTFLLCLLTSVRLPHVFHRHVLEKS